jgi:putative ABC transport system ATP-binding protein
MLSISRTSLGHGERAVLAFAGLDLPDAAHCLVMGQSGTGKTTLLYAIAGLARVFDGTIVINDTDVTALGEAERDRFRGRNIGIVFQTLHLVRSLSVLDNLLLALYLAGIPQDRRTALKALERLEIADKKDARPETLSQGQAQRVAIARALLHKPAVILADEPTSSLDDRSAETSIRLIKDVAEETGANLVDATHDGRVRSAFERIVRLGPAP